MNTNELSTEGLELQEEFLYPNIMYTFRDNAKLFWIIPRDKKWICAEVVKVSNEFDTPLEAVINIWNR